MPIEADKIFFDLLTEENARKAVEEIIDSFHDVNGADNKKMVEYDFKWQNGEFISGEVNTWFKFDTEDGTILREVRDLLCDPQSEPTEANIKLFDEFRENIKYYLQKDYKDLFLNKLRDQVLDLPKNIIPLQNMTVKEIEITDKPDIDYVIVVEKNASETFNPGSFAQLIMNEMVKTGEDPQEVVDRKIKENGGKDNPDNMWAFIERAYKRKYLFEVQIDLFVDYSLSKIPQMKIVNN